MEPTQARARTEEQITFALKRSLPEGHVEAMLAEFRPVEFPNGHLGFQLRSDPSQTVKFERFIEGRVQVCITGTRRDLVRWGSTDGSRTAEEFVSGLKRLIDVANADRQTYIDAWNRGA